VIIWSLNIHRHFIAPSAPLHEAAFSGDLEAMDKFLDRDPAAINQLATFRLDPRLSTITPLMWAVRGGHEQAVQRLLDRGADPNIADHLSRTALHLAAWDGNVDIVQRLLAAGADVNAVTPAHSSALVFAVKGKHDDLVEFLLRESADIGAGVAYARVVAAEQGSARAIELLLESGPSANREELQDLLRRAETRLRVTADQSAVADVIRSRLD